MSSDEAEFEFGTKDDEDEQEDDDNDEQIANSRKRRASTKSKSYTEDDDSDDDEDDDFDDVPLAQLKSPKKKANTTSEAKKAPAQKKTKTETAPASKKVTSKPVAEATKKAASAEDYRSISAVMFGSECAKGQLIQKLLCRWWYSIKWPTNLPSNPPPTYDALDGMPGVYVCVEGDDVGKIKDLRDMKSKPSFANFLSKGSEELKDLLILAIQEQMKALVDSEGEGTATEKELKEMLKWAHKVNADKADKEAARVLKKAGMASQ